MKIPKKVACPRCGEPALFSPENPWRPFCSERCKMIDLGAWFAEKHVIPGEEIPSTIEEDEGSGERPRLT